MNHAVCVVMMAATGAGESGGAAQGGRDPGEAAVPGQ